MTGVAWLLAVVFMVMGTAGIGDGLAAYESGDFPKAVAVLREVLPSKPSYEGYLTLGLALGRLNEYGPARVAFDRALILAPRRPEAWIERGGLSFLERDYAAAAADLEQALARRDDTYTRDLLATSLHLAGRTDEALRHWNTIGRPVLVRVRILGLTHTRDRVVRRELALAEGQPLRLKGLHKSRLRLAELGIFPRVALRTIPGQNARADLDVNLVERHGLWGSPLGFVGASLLNALVGRARLRYWNLSGEGVNLGGEYRWQENRPRLLVHGDWPRPFGLPVNLRLAAHRGRQGYDMGDRFELKDRGLELRLRHVVGSRTVAQLRLISRQRTFSVQSPDAPSGLVMALEVGAEQRVFETRRQRFDVSGRGFLASSALGSELEYTRLTFDGQYRLALAVPKRTTLERSTLAVRVFGGWGAPSTPLDAFFAPGASPEMELPLRGHHQLRDGRLGRNLLTRKILLVNAEWRRRLHRGAVLQVGAVFFYDGLWTGPDQARVRRTLHDVGMGVRVAVPGGPLLRVDFGYSLTDGSQALSFGLGHVF